MFLGLRGKHALVAAASRGLGYAIAKELATEGAIVVICARNKDSLKDARARIETETGAKVYGIAADLSRYEDVRRVMTTSIEKLGHLDILVNNNGGPPAGPVGKHERGPPEGALHTTPPR